MSDKLKENIEEFIKAALDNKPSAAQKAFNAALYPKLEALLVQAHGEVARNVLQAADEDDDDEEIEIEVDLEDEEQLNQLTDEQLDDILGKLNGDEDDEDVDEDVTIEDFVSKLEALSEDEFAQVWEELDDEVKAAVSEYVEKVAEGEKSEKRDEIKRLMKDYKAKGGKVTKLPIKSRKLSGKTWDGN